MTIVILLIAPLLNVHQDNNFYYIYNNTNSNSNIIYIYSYKMHNNNITNSAIAKCTPG